MESLTDKSIQDQCEAVGSACQVFAKLKYGMRWYDGAARLEKTLLALVTEKVEMCNTHDDSDMYEVAGKLVEVSSPSFPIRDAAECHADSVG